VGALNRFVADTIAGSICGFTRFITGAQARWIGCAPVPARRVISAITRAMPTSCHLGVAARRFSTS